MCGAESHLDKGSRVDTVDVDYTIRPGVGLGPIILGLREDDVRALLSEPTDSMIVDYGDGLGSRESEFKGMGLSLYFSQEDGYRLGSITTSSDRAMLAGSCMVGLPETALLASSFGGLGPPVLDDDFGES